MLLLLSLSLYHCCTMVGGGGGLHTTWQGQLLTDPVQDRERWINTVVNWWLDGGMEGWLDRRIPQGLCVCPPLTGAVSAGCNAESLTNTLTWSQTQQLPGRRCNCLLAAWAELKSRGVTECVNMSGMSKRLKEREKSSREEQIWCVCALSLIFYPDCPFLSMKTSTVIIKIWLLSMIVIISEASFWLSSWTVSL